jgi:hypothetical protein
VFQDHGRSTIARIAADRESIMVLGKTRFGGFFFAWMQEPPKAAIF